MRPGAVYEHSNAPPMHFYVGRLGLFQWESSPHSTFPQELVLKLEYRAEVSHILLQCEQEKEINDLAVYVGDSVSRDDQSASQIDFRLAG